MKKKGLIFLITSLLSISFVAGVYAATTFKLVVNGKSINADIKLINGVTYLPLRVVADAVGATIDLNNQTKTITLTTASTNTAVNKQVVKEEQLEEKQATRKKPAKLGEVVKFTNVNNSTTVTGKISVVDSIRGKGAWSILKLYNKFENDPIGNEEYVLMKIQIDIDSNTKEDAAITISPSNFNMVSSFGTDYSYDPLILLPKNMMAKIYVGGTFSGWTAFKVKKDDPSPLLVYGRNYDGTSGVWFETPVAQ